MNWRSPRFILSILVVCVVLIVAVVAILNISRSSQPPTQPHVIVPPLPTPGAARSIYTNPQYEYTIHYPSQWYLKQQTNNPTIRIFMKYNLSVPQAVAYEIRCYPNPNQLDAKTYWQQSHLANEGEIGKGITTFSSGVSAYLTTGQGQTPFTLYTLVHGQAACSILVPATDPPNAQVVLASINSFHWQ